MKTESGERTAAKKKENDDNEKLGTSTGHLVNRFKFSFLFIANSRFASWLLLAHIAVSAFGAKLL